MPDMVERVAQQSLDQLLMQIADGLTALQALVTMNSERIGDLHAVLSRHSDRMNELEAQVTGLRSTVDGLHTA